MSFRRTPHFLRAKAPALLQAWHMVELWSPPFHPIVLVTACGVSAVLGSFWPLALAVFVHGPGSVPGQTGSAMERSLVDFLRGFSGGASECT
jgi:hypothetical protein